MADDAASPPPAEQPAPQPPTIGKPGKELPPAEQPKERRRDSRTDFMQLGLLVLFVVMFFATAFSARSGFILNGRFAELVFLSLAASITLYYFLDTVANVSQTTYSLAGAGAVFIVVLTIGLYYTSSEDEIAKRDARISDLTSQLTQRSSVNIKGQVINQQTQKSIDGNEKDLKVGVMVDGSFYSNEAGDEHYYTIENVPTQKTYKVVVIETAHAGKLFTKVVPQDSIGGGITMRIPLSEGQP